MTRMFLDPQRPLITCTQQDCRDCPLKADLVCHFNGAQLTRFLLISLSVFVVSISALVMIDAWLLLPWAVILLAFFFVLENQVMCAHCPHYAEEDINTLKCWANYGFPKIWEYNPGPMTLLEKGLFTGGLALVFLFPLYHIAVASRWLLLVLFIVALAAGAWGMVHTMCIHCMNFACPFNRVDDSLRQKFFERNPEIAEAWKAGEPFTAE